MPKPLSRREALRTGLLAGAAALSIPPLAPAGSFTGKIRKAVKFHMVQEDLSVADKFRLLQDLGFDGTEIQSSDKTDPTEIEAAIASTGLPVHGVIHSSNPDIDSAIRLSKRFGGSSVLVVARYDHSLSLQENWDRDLASFRAAAQTAETEQIHVLLENVWASYLISAFDVRAMLDAVGSPWVGSYFDVGNNVRWGVPEHWIRHLGTRIHKLDIKEFDTTKHMNEGLRAGFSVPIGEGSIDWAAVRAELATLEFTGWATAEVKGGDRTRLAQIAQEMDRVLDLAP